MVLFLTTACSVSGQAQKADNVTSTYDFENVTSLTLRVSAIYYGWTTADGIRLRFMENRQEYSSEVVSLYADNWETIDNYSLTVENLVDWVGPIMENLTITGEWKLENDETIWHALFSAGVRGYRERVIIRLAPGYLSYVNPAPTERYIENGCETIVYEVEKETLITVKSTDIPTLLLSTVVSEKVTGLQSLLVGFGTVFLIGLCIALIAIVQLKRRARISGKEFSPKHFPRLVQVGGLVNGLLLMIAGVTGLNLLGLVLFVMGLLMLLFILAQSKILPALPKIKITVDLKSHKQLLGLLLVLNALWISAAFLVDAEFQRAVAFNINATIPFLLAVAGVLAVPVILGFGFATPKRKRGLRTATIKKFSALAGKLGIAKPDSLVKELEFGLLVALGLAAALLPIMHFIGARSIIFGELVNRMTIIGALLLALSSGFWEEIIFRGLMQPKFGLLLTSLFFGVIHCAYGFIPNVLLAIFAGIVLGMIYGRRKNICAPIIAHTVFNLAALLILA